MVLERVQKTLSAAGYCSRRKAEELIAEGRVFVNGKVIKLGDQADPGIDKVFVDGSQIRISTKKYYYLLNKPKGYITALSDPFGKRTITNLLFKNGIKERVFPVGRLDENTEGLILLTNDGEFANRVMHPRYETEKTYEARLDRPVNTHDLEQLERGIIILDRKTWPAKTRYISHDRRVVEVTIHEGRNKIVRRMFKKLGYNVLALQRTKIGHLTLGSLKPGAMRKLSESEINSLSGKRK